MADKKRILLVDDDPMFQRLFGGKLSKVDYDVIYASSGAEGREMARRLKPDVILMDVRMPGDENGFETAQRLKEEKETAHIPISLLTSEDLSIEAEQALKELSNVTYMHKSVQTDEFLETVDRLMKAAEESTESEK